MRIDRDSFQTGLFALGWLLLCGWYWYIAVFPDWRDERALIQRAKTAQGVIIDAVEYDGESNLSYAYTLPNGTRHTADTQDDPNDFVGKWLNNPNQQYPVTVEYLPDEPTVSRLQGTGCQTLNDWYLRRIGFGLLVALVMCYWPVLAFLSIVRLKQALPPAPVNDVALSESDLSDDEILALLGEPDRRNQQL